MFCIIATCVCDQSLWPEVQIDGFFIYLIYLILKLIIFLIISQIRKIKYYSKNKQKYNQTHSTLNVDSYNLDFLRYKDVKYIVLKIVGNKSGK